VGVDAQGEPRVVMAQVLGHRPDVDAILQQRARVVVPRRVHAVVPRGRHAGRVERGFPHMPVEVRAGQRRPLPGREQQPHRLRPAGRLAPGKRDRDGRPRFQVGGQPQRDRLGQRHVAGLAGLGRGEHEPAGDDANLPAHVHDAAQEVDVVHGQAEATSRFYAAVVDRLLTHDGSSGLARHVGNAILKEDSRGGRLAKEHKDSRRRIDAAVAAVMAHDRAAVLAGDRGPSIYV